MSAITLRDHPGSTIVTDRCAPASVGYGKVWQCVAHYVSLCAHVCNHAARSPGHDHHDRQVRAGKCGMWVGVE
eukprot:366331-Chlamydomonas_euryale.AAC.10